MNTSISVGPFSNSQSDSRQHHALRGGAAQWPPRFVSGQRCACRGTSCCSSRRTASCTWASWSSTRAPHRARTLTSRLRVSDSHTHTTALWSPVHPDRSRAAHTPEPCFRQVRHPRHRHRRPRRRRARLPSAVAVHASGQAGERLRGRAPQRAALPAGVRGARRAGLCAEAGGAKREGWGRGTASTPPSPPPASPSPPLPPPSPPPPSLRRRTRTTSPAAVSSVAAQS